MNFASDNTVPIAPAILDAIGKANEGYARGYGNDLGLERRLDVYDSRRPYSSLDGMAPNQAYYPPLPLRLAA